MTATQLAFAFAATVVAGGFGLCGGIACVATTLGSRRGFMVATVATWFGLGLAGVVAALCYPSYPVEGPPEHVAMLFVLPCLLTGTVAVMLLMQFAPERPDGLVRPGDLERDHRRAKRVLVVGVVLSSLVLMALPYVLVMPMHRALPWSARQVRESYWGDGFLPDYSYCLKARIPEGEFASYVASLGLTPHTESRVYEDDKTWLSWAHPVEPTAVGDAWWDPPPIQPGKTYVAQGGDSWVLAAYRDGWIYVSGHNH